MNDVKTEAYIKQLESEKHELKEQLRDVSRALHVQSEGWKKEKNKTLELMFSKCIVISKLCEVFDVVTLIPFTTGELPLTMLSELPSDLTKGSASLIKNFPMVTIAQW